MQFWLRCGLLVGLCFGSRVSYGLCCCLDVLFGLVFTLRVDFLFVLLVLLLFGLLFVCLLIALLAASCYCLGGFWTTVWEVLFVAFWDCFSCYGMGCVWLYAVLVTVRLTRWVAFVIVFGVTVCVAFRLHFMLLFLLMSVLLFGLHFELLCGLLFSGCTLVAYVVALGLLVGLRCVLFVGCCWVACCAASELQFESRFVLFLLLF